MSVIRILSSKFLPTQATIPCSFFMNRWTVCLKSLFCKKRFAANLTGVFYAISLMNFLMFDKSLFHSKTRLTNIAWEIPNIPVDGSDVRLQGGISAETFPAFIALTKNLHMLYFFVSSQTSLVAERFGTIWTRKHTWYWFFYFRVAHFQLNLGEWKCLGGINIVWKILRILNNKYLFTKSTHSYKISWNIFHFCLQCIPQ